MASPVPADIDIANAVEPLPIADIAAELGLRPDHYDLYGKYKAKVRTFLIGPSLLGPGGPVRAVRSDLEATFLSHVFAGLAVGS